MICYYNLRFKNLVFKNRLTVLILLLISSASCDVDKNFQKFKAPPLFTKLSSEKTNISFENSITNTQDLNIFNYRNFYNGGGVAIGDINNDGFSDIVLTANQGSNKIYLNQKGFEFKDITESSGMSGKNTWSTGVVMVDINADGWLDIYICNAGNVDGDNQKNELYINNKDLTFTEKAEAYNLADTGFTTHAAFVDYDKDGDLDVYLLNNSFVPVNSLSYSNKRELRSKDWNVKDILKGGGDKLLRNDNDLFVDVSESAGIYGSLIGFGLGITIGDINNDLWPDIYVSNDFYEQDYLYINNKNGTFSEEIKAWTPHISLSSMGTDLADINNDGHPDIFVTDMLPEANQRLKETTEFEGYDIFELKQRKNFHKQYMQNTLQLNNGNQSFSEIAFYSGIAMTDWSWGAVLFDMDNDGFKDVFVSNGISHDLTNQDFMDFFADDILKKMIRTGKKIGMDTIVKRMPSTPIPNFAFKNNKDLTFSNVVKPWGFEENSFSNGSSYGDLDNDGDLDLVVNNVNQPVFVYRNETNHQTTNTHIRLKLLGKDRNTFGIGSIVNMYIQDEIIHQQVQPSRGFQSSVDYVMTIGTGQYKKIDSLIITWPDNSRQVMKNIVTNQLVTLDQKEAGITSSNKLINENNIFLTEVKNASLLKHEENHYIDFNYEGLIYKMLSKEGPVISVSDVDNDGVEDFFIGGSKGQSGQIYLQKEKGFLKKRPIDLSKDSDFEDTAAAFLDANGDGHVDLLVGSGGNQIDGMKSNFDLRLYLNNGKGDFTKSTLKIPSNFYNTSIIAPYDYDSDGDIDVFVGSRSVPGVYGMNPSHFLLENDGKGNFTNQLKEKAVDLKQLGMITDATWADMNTDGIKDLVVTEDWGGVHIYLTKDAKLTRLRTNLTALTGWWKTCATKDIDNDGDIDIVLGNSGTNSIYKPDSTNVLKMYINDFDNNGAIEQIFTTSVNGEDVPVHLKRELTNQVPILKKKNLRFAAYAKKTIHELFPAKKIERTIKKSVGISESVVAINNGESSFVIKKLPPQAQFSCINDIALLDLNNDGNLDIIFGGNNYSLKPQFSQLDASFGGVLLGDGKANFNWVNYADSGFFIDGVINSIKTFNSPKKDTRLIIGINDEIPLIYEVQQHE
ncbi:CRTAC1 family protein [Aquimarina sp. AD10]|nr:CRTAC1 family protein [Aquimarina sp. AD10]RKN01928.1 CRTAC1 family protein [Aquimarina sp. AD10]